MQSGCPWSPYPLSGSHQSLLEGRHMLGQVGGAPPTPVFPRPLPSGRAVRKTVGPPGSRWLGPLGGGAGVPRPCTWAGVGWEQQQTLSPGTGFSGHTWGPPRAHRQGAPTLTPKPTKVRALRQAAWPRGEASLAPSPVSRTPVVPAAAPAKARPRPGPAARARSPRGGAAPAWASLAAAACPADTPSPHIWVGPPQEERGPRPGARLAPMDPCSRAMVGSGQGLLPPQFFALSGPKVSKPYTEKIRTETKPKHRKPTKQPQSG